MLEILVVVATLTCTAVAAAMAHARSRTAEATLARYARSRGLARTALKCASGLARGVPYSVMVADDDGAPCLRISAGTHARSVPPDADADRLDAACAEVVHHARASSGAPPYR